MDVHKKKRISKKGITRQFRENIKTKRNSGKEYMTQQGKLVPARMLKPLMDCRSKCKDKIDINLQQTLFDGYWSLNSYDRRVSYMANLIVPTNKIANRKRTDNIEKQKNRQVTYKYFIPKNNELIVVCKLCFLSIFGEKPKFIQKICTQKVQSPVQKQTPDKRGKRAPRNKLSKRSIDLVQDHIKMLPSYESHYCRKETTKKYLPAYFTLKLVYDDYVENVDNPVSMSVYRQYFKQAGLKIKQPKKDTCALCDRFKIQISNNISSSEEKAALIIKKNKHHDEAEETYEAKRKDSKTNDVNKCVIAFDLQQCLPTPSLESSVAFYKRQLWTFNLTVHNIQTSNASCYIWNETIAKRGANDIGSCVFHYLANLPLNITHVVMYSDNCGGQNKNSIFMAMCLAFLEKQDTIQIIDHKFMISGHTRMECDSDHGRIEKAKKRYGIQINHPYDWAQLIRYAGKEKFNVIEIQQSNFQDFNSLLKTKYKFKKKNEAGQVFSIRNVQWLRYNKSDKNIVSYKLSLNDDEIFHKMDLTKRNALCDTPIPKAYNEELPITEEKKKDLMSLLQFIPELYHTFYKNLKTKNDVSDPFVSDEGE